MYKFHASLHARPENAIPGMGHNFGGVKFATLDIPPDEVATPFAISFEQAVKNLSRLERMFIEGDGSFVWVSSQQNNTWQIDGNLYDRKDKLWYVDLKGTCPTAEWDRLLAAFGWPQTAVVFQVVQAAVFLAETEFRRLAETMSNDEWQRQ